MNREELIQELKWALPDNRIKNVIAYGAVDLHGEMIVLKNRFDDDYEPQDVYEYNKLHSRFVDEDLKDLQGKSVIFSPYAFSMRGLMAMYKYTESKEKKNEKIVIEGEARENILEGQVVASVYDYNTHTDLDDALLIHEGKKVRVTIEVLS